jgi:hypothetical protein
VAPCGPTGPETAEPTEMISLDGDWVRVMLSPTRTTVTSEMRIVTSLFMSG